MNSDNMNMNGTWRGEYVQLQLAQNAQIGHSLFKRSAVDQLTEIGCGAGRDQVLGETHALCSSSYMDRS
jgi:hypothetical protein